MQTFVKNSADKWIVYADFQPWMDKLVADIGGTVDITAADWTLDSALVKEAETPASDIGGKVFLVGSGGVAGESYDASCQVTYTPSTIPGLTDATKTFALTITMEAA